MTHSPTGAVAVRYQLREYLLPVVVDDLNCNGSEERLTNCSHNSPGFTNCHDGNDASVVCQPLDGNRNCRICSSCNFYVFTIIMKHFFDL